MKVQIALKDSFCVLKTLKVTDYKVTSLCIRKQHLGRSSKLDTSKVFILKEYLCDNQNIKRSKIQRWINRNQQIQIGNRINWAQVQQNQTQICLYIAQEYLPYGDLSELIDPEWKIDCDILLNLAQNIKKYHDNGLVIANLKPNNIMLTKNQKQTYIIDARMRFLDQVFEKSSEYKKSKLSLYTASEIYKDQYYDEAADIFSLGWIFLELTTHERLKDLQKTTIKEKVAILERFEQSTLQRALKPIIQQMVRKDWRKRLSIDEVITELQKIKKMHVQNQAFGTSNQQLIKFYLPLMKLSPNHKFYSTQFIEKFKIALDHLSIEIMVDEDYEFLKIAVNIKGSLLLSIFMYDQLTEDFKQSFKNVKELYQSLKRQQSSLKITNTAFLVFRHQKNQGGQKQPLKQASDRVISQSKNTKIENLQANL